MCNTYDERRDPYLEQARFSGVVHIEFIRLDYTIITTVFERWRPKMHTFHMAHEEVGLTLQDIVPIFGLPIDGLSVIGIVTTKVGDMCERLLGARPKEENLKGQ